MGITGSNYNLSVLLATYNGEKYLPLQLSSLLTQTYSDFDIWIHDDGSSDQTVVIIRDYANKNPQRIFFLDDSIILGSASANFNYLLQQTNNKYIMFCDQDDVWFPDKISMTFNVMYSMEKKFPQCPILIHSDLVVVNEKLQTINESFWRYQHISPERDNMNHLLQQNTVTGCTMMINSQLANLALPFSETAIMHDWWLAMVASEFGYIVPINKSTMLYRQHSNNDTGAISYNFEYIFKKIFSFLNRRSLLDMQAHQCAQANAFLQHYQDCLSLDTIELLNAFIYLPSYSWMKRRLILLKHRFLKFGLIRNIGLFLRI